MSDTIESTALTIAEARNLSVIFTERGVEAVITRIEREARDQASAIDATTPKGRATLRSLRYKVVRSKTTIDDAGKELNESKRAEIGLVDEDRRLARSRLDALAAEIVAPVEEYEAREKNRVQTHETAIADFTFIVGAVAGQPSSQEVAKVIDQVTDMHRDRDWEEFTGKAHKERQLTLETLRAVYQSAKTREDEAEAARIAAEEQAEREREAAVLAQIAREERIAAEAAERAKVAAEEEAARKACEAEERAQAVLHEQALAAERERAEALRREREAAEAILRVEREKQDAIDQAEASREAAARQAERDQIAAVEAERKRVAMEAEWLRKEDERRAADRAHRAKINHQALEDLMERCQWPEGTPLAEALARKIVTAIAKGEIRNIKVQY